MPLTAYLEMFHWSLLLIGSCMFVRLILVNLKNNGTEFISSYKWFEFKGLFVSNIYIWVFKVFLKSFNHQEFFCGKYKKSPFLKLGLRARKPVFGGVRTTKAQTSLRIRAV